MKSGSGFKAPEADQNPFFDHQLDASLSAILSNFGVNANDLSAFSFQRANSALVPDNLSFLRDFVHGVFFVQTAWISAKTKINDNFVTIHRNMSSFNFLFLIKQNFASAAKIYILEIFIIFLICICILHFHSLLIYCLNIIQSLSFTRFHFFEGCPLFPCCLLNGLFIASDLHQRAPDGLVGVFQATAIIHAVAPFLPFGMPHPKAAPQALALVVYLGGVVWRVHGCINNFLLAD